MREAALQVAHDRRGVLRVDVVDSLTARRSPVFARLRGSALGHGPRERLGNDWA